MTKYVKKPIPVEAYAWDGTYNFNPAPDFRPIFDYAHIYGEEKGILTAEGVMKLVPGSYIVKGPAGEYWAVRKDIFENTYVKVETNESNAT